MKVAVNIKGQVVIPAQLRHSLRIKKGTKLYIEERDGELILRPLNRDYFQKMSGVLKGTGLLKRLGKERKDDLGNEDEKTNRALN